jgi:hypothetical protein
MISNALQTELAGMDQLLDLTSSVLCRDDPEAVVLDLNDVVKQDAGVRTFRQGVKP